MFPLTPRYADDDMAHEAISTIRNTAESSMLCPACESSLVWQLFIFFQK